MEERSIRIIKTAVELAERGGYEAVRLRDVAAQAEVALGTLYKRFRSKEDILVAALELEAESLDRRMAKHPIPGDTAFERVCSFYEAVTKALCRRPNFARAVLRAVASGDPELAEKVARFHGRMTRLITATLLGGRPEANETDSFSPSGREKTLASVLQHIWFSSLVGWVGGLRSEAAIIEQMRTAAELLLRGMNDEP